jgi:hypothetical protein
MHTLECPRLDAIEGARAPGTRGQRTQRRIARQQKDLSVARAQSRLIDKLVALADSGASATAEEKPPHY